MTSVKQDAAAGARRPITRAQAAWLDAESASWVEAGALGTEQRARILDSYATESGEHRSMMALMLLGTLMFAIGILLLIGYNWSGLDANVKVAMLLASVAAAYGGSALASARGRSTVAEVAAFAGVLLFGNAIFLIAQVLHTQGDLPDAFMWWAVGALATTVLVRSRSVGIAASALVFAWAIVALIDVNRPLATFALVWLATVWSAYWIGSPTMIRVSAAAAAFWVVALTHRQEAVAVGATALAACALFAVGSWHRVPDRMSRAWQNTSLTILLVTFVPLLIPDFHDDLRGWSATVPGIGAVLVLMAAALSPLARIRSTADAVVGLTAMVLIGWFGALAAGLVGGPATALLGTVLFSVLSLVLAVGLIRAALRLDSTPTLILGVGFALAFLILRWVSLIDSMLWSGLMLLMASAGFFVVARLWRGRRQLLSSAG